MVRIQCFLLEPTGRSLISVCRDEHTSDPCPLDGGPNSRHFNRAVVSTVEDGQEAAGFTDARREVHQVTACKCGFVFTENAKWAGSGSSPVYRRSDTGEEIELRNAPAGAMWFRSEPFVYNGMGVGPDGRSLHVRTPGGDWCIDSRASNCGLPEDNEHRCWVRHGEPPIVTVDKSGNTCNAGAGSIQCGSYHGFLRDGWLVD